MADINKVKKINGKDIVVNWDNVDNKPDDLAKISDIEEQIEQVRSEMPSVEGLASEEYVDDRFEELTGAAPEALDTLEELAKALGEDENFSSTIIEELSKKQNTLTFDETPTRDSINPVTSGGLFETLFSKMDCVEIYEDELDNIEEGFYKFRFNTEPSPGVSAQILYSYTYVFAWKNYDLTNPLYVQIKIGKGMYIRIKQIDTFEWGLNPTPNEWTEWRLFLDTSDIVDNLVTDSATQPLSASMGKFLDELKVNKVEGKDLSTNDFTNDYKLKVDNFRYIYMQPEEPTDAPEGSLWIDTDEELGTLPIAEEASF